MNNGAFGENFPYSNFHDLNMDWIIKIAKDFLDQYSQIQETLNNGLTELDEHTQELITDLNATAVTLQTSLNAWYEEHQNDISTELANALTELANELASAISEFNDSADQKASEVLESIPDDYTALGTSVTETRKENRLNNRMVTHILSDGVYIGADWISGKTINSETGELISASGWYSMGSMVEVPTDAVVNLHMIATPFRLALYDIEGNFISASNPASVDVNIDSSNIGFFRVAYNASISINDGKMLIRVQYKNGRLAHLKDILNRISDTIIVPNDFKFTTTKDYYAGERCVYLNRVYKFIQYHSAGAWNSEHVISDSVENLHYYSRGERNPVILTNTGNNPFIDFRISSQTADSAITICGKNIFKMTHTEKVAYEYGNVRYDFNHEEGSIRVQSTGATANVPSAGTSFPSDNQTVNGISGIFNNFKFKFKHDTVVSIHPHCSVFQPCDYHSQMRVTDGTTFIPIDNDGLVFTASGGTEYGVQILTRTGWEGDITYRPQIEVNDKPTAWEKYDGTTVTLPLVGGYENLFNLPIRSGTGKFEYSGVVAIFDGENDEIYIKGTAPNEAVITISNPYYATLNNISYNSIFKFTLDQDRVVCARVIPEELSNICFAEFSDGTNIWVDRGHGCIFEGASGKEYGFVIKVYNGAFIDTTIKPIISTDRYALQLYGSKLGTTTVFTNDNTIIRIVAETKNGTDNLQTATGVTNALIKLTAGKVMTPLTRFENDTPILTIIDDDTSTLALVERFHNILSAENAVGNYAVMTKHVDEEAGLLQRLLEYEEEGFGCLYHCYYQYGSATDYWKSYNPAYDEDAIKENFMRGLRSMNGYGFSNFKYWVTPYGVNDDFIQHLAQTHGMKCLLNCPTVNYVTSSYISTANNVNRWNIPRLSYEPSSSDTKFHKIAEACADNKGWLSIVTHANTWGNTTTMDDKLTAFIRYCKNLGYRIVSVPEAFSKFEPMFLLNELF